MERLMLILVEPQKWDKNSEDWIGVTDDEKEMKVRWGEYKRLLAVLEGLGFKKMEGRDSSFSFECEGCNWEAQMCGQLLTLSPSALLLLEDKALDLAILREQALKKLTPEEQYALGILKQP